MKCSSMAMVFMGRSLWEGGGACVPVWYRGFALLLGAAVWAGGVVAQIYVFLIWLEGRAAQKDRSARGIRVAVPPGVLAHLKYSRALPAWILVALCVAEIGRA